MAEGVASQRLASPAGGGPESDVTQRSPPAATAHLRLVSGFSRPPPPSSAWPTSSLRHLRWLSRLSCLCSCTDAVSSKHPQQLFQ